MPFRLIENDCLAALRAAGDEKVHAIVTDPPYGLSKEPNIEEVLTKWLAGEDYEHRGGGFMGQTWDSFVPGPSVWREALRVLKPGGHVLAFASPRTADLMAISLRIAGFEIRDTFEWIYGQGFPKSHNIGKGIDQEIFKRWLETQPECAAYLKSLKRGSDEYKAYEATLLEAAGLTREIVGERSGDLPNGAHGLMAGEERVTRDVTIAASEEAAEYDDWGTALKPAQEPIIVARKPLGYMEYTTPTGRPGRKRMNVAQNVMAHRVGGYNLGATRIPTDESLNGGTYSEGARHADGLVGNPNGWGVASGMFQAGKGRMPGQFVQPEGRHPANLIVGHHDDCVALDEFVEVGGDGRAGQPLEGTRPGGFVDTGAESGSSEPNAAVHGATQRQVYLCHPDCAVRRLDSNAGSVVSRFFYCPKVDKKERDAGLEHFSAQFAPTMGAGIGNVEHTPATAALKKNTHPTVKPIALMEWLISLVTPENGVVLDLYMGSGTTGIAALRLGHTFIGIEREPEYMQIARARIAHWAPEAVGEYVAPPAPYCNDPECPPEHRIDTPCPERAIADAASVVAAQEPAGVPA